MKLYLYIYYVHNELSDTKDIKVMVSEVQGSQKAWMCAHLYYSLLHFDAIETSSGGSSWSQEAGVWLQALELFYFSWTRMRNYQLINKVHKY